MNVIENTRKTKYLRSFSELHQKVSDAGYVPPSDLPVEKALLGAMMIDKQALSKVFAVIGERNSMNSPFHDDRHSEIYTAMVQLDVQKKPVDIFQTANQLRANGVLDLIGGTEYLIELTSSVVTTANVESYARLVIEKHLARELIRTCEETKLRVYAGADDVFALLDTAESELFRLSETRHTRSYRRAGSLSHDVTEYLDKQEKGGTGIMSGLTDLDEITCGWQNTDLVIVGARPSMGKTAFALHLQREASLTQGVPTAIFSLEMSAQQLALRLLCSQSRVNMKKARSGKLTPEEWKRFAGAIEKINTAPIFIDDTPAITPLEIRAKCRRLKQTENIGLVIVDYLQLMEAGKDMDSREREISKISRSLKALAKELNVPVIALSQLNRSVESRQANSRRPILSDLRESGAIEQDADVVIFIHRQEYYKVDTYNDNTPTENTAEIIVAKQRNGDIGDARVYFEKETGVFRNLSRY